MKRIWLLRHAKASPDPRYTADADRPITGRGKHDAIRVGTWMQACDLRPDLVLVSPALRALQTSDHVLGALGYDGAVHHVGWLYPGDPAESLEALRKLEDWVTRVLLVGHNPHMTDFGSLLCAGGRAELRVRTGAVQLYAADLEGWSALDAGAAELEGMVWPAITPPYSSKKR
jgi:phosphohistidine phosphatase